MTLCRMSVSNTSQSTWPSQTAMVRRPSRPGHASQEEKPRRLFRPVRGVDLKIAWQIHAREMRLARWIAFLRVGSG